jgi:hypothetical protein
MVQVQVMVHAQRDAEGEDGSCRGAMVAVYVRCSLRAHSAAVDELTVARKSAQIPSEEGYFTRAVIFAILLIFLHSSMTL